MGRLLLGSHQGTQELLGRQIQWVLGCQAPSEAICQPSKEEATWLWSCIQGWLVCIARHTVSIYILAHVA